MLVDYYPGRASPILVNFGLGAAPPEAYFRDDTNRTWEKIALYKSHLGKNFAEAQWGPGIGGAIWWDLHLAGGLVLHLASNLLALT